MNNTAESDPKFSKFLLVGQPRCGTTFLMQLLNSSPFIFCDNELFNPYKIVHHTYDDLSEKKLLLRESDKKQFLNNFFLSNHEKDRKSLGFNYMLGHAPELLNYFLSDESYKIIFIQRNNLLAQYASWKKALVRKEWATSSTFEAFFQKRRKIKFDVNEYIRLSGRYQFKNSIFTHLLSLYKKEENICIVEYREIANLSKLKEKVFSFLETPIPDSINIKIKKQGGNLIMNRFSNKREVRRFFKATNRSDWLEREMI